VGSAVIFIHGSPKAVDEAAACLYKERLDCVCIDAGLIPQPKGEAVPDKEKLTVIVGDLSWIRYPPVRSDPCHLYHCVFLFPDPTGAALRHALFGRCSWSLEMMNFLLRVTSTVADPLGRPVVMEGDGPVAAAYFMS